MTKTYALKPRNKRKTEQDIGTPEEFFLQADKEFLFAWDLAATAKNAKCANYLDKSSGAGQGTTEKGGSLTVDWHKLAPGRWLWLNPPYNALPQWYRKCDEECQKGAKIALLVPFSNTQAWRAHAWGKQHIRLLNERLIFDYVHPKGPNKGKQNVDPYPKDCQLILFNREWKTPTFKLWSWKTDTYLDWSAWKDKIEFAEGE